jgi:hypothetical protein
VLAETEKMQFEALEPSEPIEAHGNGWTIYAEGVIDPEAGERLNELIETKHIAFGSTIYLNSSGGNMLGGLELGRVIRSHGLNTYIGVKGKKIIFEQLDKIFRNNLYETSPGECLSSCSLAFLGGKFRYVGAGSVYGVHRFYFDNNKQQNSDDAQVLSAIIVQYIRDMGIDSKLFSEMTRAGKDEINIIDLPHLKKYDVVNDGIERTIWTIESLSTGLYLKGEQDTVFGHNELMFTCPGRRKINMLATFSAVHESLQETMSRSAPSIMVDGNRIPVPKLNVIGVDVVNGRVRVGYVLAPKFVDQIISADRVGVALQYSYGAATFIGFDSMDFTIGREKFRGFIASCR